MVAETSEVGTASNLIFIPVIDVTAAVLALTAKLSRTSGLPIRQQLTVVASSACVLAALRVAV